MTSVLFKNLQVGGWRQFESVDIDLHPRLTVITGANGSGKSTLLSMFSRHFGWSRPLLSVPQQDKMGKLSYVVQLHEIKRRKNFKRQFPNQIGAIKYTNGEESPIAVDNISSTQYNFNIPNNFSVHGLFIDSHRVSPSYQAVTNISLQATTAQQAYNTYNSELLSRFLGQSYVHQYSPIYRMKEALISMAVFGEGNSQVGHDFALLEIYNGFNEVLRSILPTSLGFERISVRKPEVVLVTKSGEFMLDAASGGISTLIDIAWRIYMFSMDKNSFVVTMDEPENHLHPTMQRSLMRRLLAAFPTAQFIIATHSPFMVSSIKDSNVYVLRYKDSEDEEFSSPETKEFAVRRVASEKLDNLNKAGNASEILREVLGVPATMPEWVEDGIHSLVEKYKTKEFSRKTLDNLRDELSDLGYSEYYPEVVAQITA